MQKTFIFSFLAFILLFSACTNGQSNVNSLSATEFAAKIKELSPTIVDVRTPEEFAKGHIENAQNIDWNGNDFREKIAAFDKSKPIFIYCLSGGRSASAASNMQKIGFSNLYELKGGIMKWRGANLPETNENTAKTTGMSKQQFEEMLKSDKAVLIDFYADWCGPCKKMKPYLEEISKEMADKVVVIRINADDNQALCKELNIDALPVLHLYKSQSLTWANTGFIDKANVAKMLQ